MDWQQVVSLGVVALAGAFLLGKFRRKPGLGEKPAFGCAAMNMSPASQCSMVFRARKGARPEVRVKLK